MSDYFILADAPGDEHCAIYDIPPAMPRCYAPAEGTRMGAQFPDGLRFTMAAEVTGITIADLISNALGYLMVSGKLRGILERCATAEIEFLRFTLMNHKRRVGSDDCYIANIIGTVDCVDAARTDGIEDPVNQGRFMRIRRLALDKDKIDPRLNIFRISARPRIVVIRDDLKAALDEAIVVGARYIAADGTTEIYE